MNRTTGILTVLSNACLLGLALAPAASARQTMQDKTQIATLTSQQREILSHMSIVNLDDGFGNPCKTIRISGVNLQIVNGLGSTDTANCLGNLIVGYNELGGNPNGDNRTGSHNIVGGVWNSFSSWGGLVVGRSNTISDQFASVSGGRSNTASGFCSSVSGGLVNTASVQGSSVSGGVNNLASGWYSSISGGIGNIASSYASSVSGGLVNTASGRTSSVSGGRVNTASGYNSSVSGGENNTASGLDSSVSGGENNTASGVVSSVSGGSLRTAAGTYNWAAGGLFEPN